MVKKDEGHQASRREKRKIIGPKNVLPRLAYVSRR